MFASTSVEVLHYARNLKEIADEIVATRFNIGLDEKAKSQRLGELSLALELVAEALEKAITRAKKEQKRNASKDLGDNQNA